MGEIKSPGDPPPQLRVLLSPIYEPALKTAIYDSLSYFLVRSRLSAALRRGWDAGLHTLRMVLRTRDRVYSSSPRMWSWGMKIYGCGLRVACPGP